MTIQITSDSAQVTAGLSPYVERIKLAISNQSISAQVTAGPHRPWCNTEHIFVANVPHNTFLWEDNRSPVESTKTSIFFWCHFATSGFFVIDARVMQQ